MLPKYPPQLPIIIIITIQIQTIQLIHSPFNHHKPYSLSLNMVETRSKNKFRIPHGTRIDLTDDSPSIAKTSKKKKPAMTSTSNPTTKKTSPAKEQVPLNVEPLKIILPEKHAALTATREDDPMSDEHKEEQAIMEKQVEDEKDDGEEDDESQPMKEKAPEPTPANIKQKRKATSIIPPSKWQKAAPSDAGSSPASAEELEEEETETTTPMPKLLKKPPKSYPAVRLAHR